MSTHCKGGSELGALRRKNPFPHWADSVMQSTQWLILNCVSVSFHFPSGQCRWLSVWSSSVHSERPCHFIAGHKLPPEAVQSRLPSLLAPGLRAFLSGPLSALARLRAYFTNPSCSPRLKAFTFHVDLCSPSFVGILPSHRISVLCCCLCSFRPNTRKKTWV